MKSLLLLFIPLLTLLSCTNINEREPDVVIVGGGASGVTAAIQAARMGMNVVVVEPTIWLGGMLTSAGVSAIDGNHKMPSGIWGEFRSHLYEYYGGPDSVFTGWVSNTLFEPSIGNEILHRMVSSEPNIRVMHGWQLLSVTVQNNELQSAVFLNQENKKKELKAPVFIDATEYGDLLAMAGAAYDRTMETSEETGENAAPEDHHPYVQDLTYVAILKDFGKGTDNTIPKPDSFDPAPFDCMCKQVCSTNNEDLLDCDYMLDYGRLPNNKFMINWPTRGNDYYAEILEKSYEERDSILQEAKDFTLSWVYFMQTIGGYENLGLATDEFPTEDLLPFIPYIRESRRVQGVDRLFLYDIQDPYNITERPLFKTGIAVADYPVDHHRKKNPVPVQFEFPKIPSYNVPYGSMIPNTLDGLIVAEKSISVSNVVNGTTRLQPVVMQLGQAAGASAALSVKNKTQPRSIEIRELQKVLLDAGMWLMPYMDTTPEDFAFKSIQRVGLSGIMRGEGIPVAWANETRFYPDSVVQYENLFDIGERLNINASRKSGNVSQFEALSFLSITLDELKTIDWFISGKDEINFTGGNDLITRAQLSWLIDNIIDPFNTQPVQIGFPNPVVN